jgi:hypothetical protein
MKKERKNKQNVSNTFNDNGFEEALRNHNEAVRIAPNPPQSIKNDISKDLENLMNSLKLGDKGAKKDMGKSISKTLLEILDFDENEPNVLEEIVDSNFKQYKIDQLKKKADPCAMCLNGFDNALVGVTYDGRLVYDKDIMYKIVLGSMDCSGNMDVRLEADELLSLIMSDDYGRLSPVFISLNMDLVLNTLK